MNGIMKFFYNYIFSYSISASPSYILSEGHAVAFELSCVGHLWVNGYMVSLIADSR